MRADAVNVSLATTGCSRRRPPPALGWFALQRASRARSRAGNTARRRWRSSSQRLPVLLIIEGMRRTSGPPMTVIVRRCADSIRLSPTSCRRPLSGTRQVADRNDRLSHRELRIRLRHPDARLRRDRGRLSRVRRRAQLHRRRQVLQRSRLRAGRARARRRRAGRRDLERAARLDQRQRHLERDHLGRGHDPGDEAHRLSRRLCRRGRGGRLDRRGADAAGHGLDRVRHGVVPRQVLRRDRARGDGSRACCSISR